MYVSIGSISLNYSNAFKITQSVNNVRFDLKAHSVFVCPIHWLDWVLYWQHSTRYLFIYLLTYLFLLNSFEVF